MSLASCSRQAHISAQDQYREARAKFEHGEILEAFDASDAGYQHFVKDQPDWAWRFKVLKAETLVWQGKSRDALDLLSDEVPSGLASDEVAVKQKIVRATASYYLQKFDKAQQDLTDAEQLAASAHPELLSDVYLGFGSLSIVRADYVSAKPYLIRSLKIAKEHNRLFSEVSALGSMGVSSMRQQHYDEAIQAESDALAVARALNNRTLITKVSANLGWCFYQMGDYERALEIFTESERESSRLGLIKDQLLWLNNIGLILQQRRDFVGSHRYFLRALEIARKLENKPAMGMTLNNLAATAIETKDFESATKYNNESLELQGEFSASGAKSDSYSVDALINEARIQSGVGHLSQSAKMLSEIIKGSTENASQRWEAESLLAGVLASSKNISKADVEYRRSLDTIDRARAGLNNEEYRLSFLTRATRFYNDYIDFLVAHNRAREALAVAEHSRARTLAEGLKVPVSQLSGAWFHPEQNARKLNSVVLSYWLKPERSYLWVVTPSKVELFPLPGQDEIDAAAQDYRKALLGPRPDAASAPGQKLYDMLVAPAAKLLPSPCPTSAAVSRCGQVTPPVGRRAAGAPKTESAPRIIVIADGSLLSLNFETLLVPAPQPHYWIEDATIANASSIALLGARNRALPKLGALPLSRSDRVGSLKPVSTSTTTPNLLLIGDPVYTGTEFPKLTQAKFEIERVESYFSPDTRSVIDGANAKPTAYAGTKPVQYDYIHFVAHGTASRVSPLDSSIVLSKEGDVYKLYARDIMAQPLRAKLVTISACYGAGNRAYSGEGLVGLSWAFLRAGAHNVIAALWEVNDASTPQLMDNLYLNVKNGEDPATALRTAKLAMLRSESVYRRPFYWGAFQLYIGS